ncbi:hypothetical protein [Halorubellus sp. PRR65]|uniref:hypothetical protein n=1 Tax=Halorubellus sp. PRR65 TaxID=3098148 RepID=UPI002B259037|nr:hypothetical protein [Halorubellus sp. PRR65]
MSDDGSTHEPPPGTPSETGLSAVETLASGEDREGRRALVRDVALLALVAGSPTVQLVGAGRVAWPTLAVAAIVVAGGLLAVAVLRPLQRLDDLGRQFALLATTAVGVVAVAWAAFVLEPGEVRFASASLGTLLGALVARIARTTDAGPWRDRT